MPHRPAPLPLLSLAAASSFFLGLPTAADPPRPTVSPEIIYTSRKEFVRVAPARPLTLNAHLTQFAYEPLGLEVAAIGSETSGDTTTHFVRTIDVRTGRELHRLSLSSAPLSDGGQAGFTLLGWTPSGKYLLLQRTQGKEDSPGESVTDLVRWDLSADPPTLRVINPAAHVPEGVASGVEPPLASPDRRWLLFGLHFYTPDTGGKPGPLQRAYLNYDAEQDAFRVLTLPPGDYAPAWGDAGHLRVVVDQKPRLLDVVSGKLSPLPPDTAERPAASKQYPDLTLNVEDRPQVDQTRAAQFPSRIVWVYCPTRLKLPLSAVGAGITMGNEDPQAVWSPTGKQLAFLNRGELYVSDVATVPNGEGLAQEKTALGLPLSCREERAIATSDLKQIGLAITQYTQDYDEKFPPAGDVDEAILPYLKDRTLYRVGGVRWAYHAPPKPSLADMDAPAEYILGTMDLPCGQVVLMGDGHVKEATRADAP